MNHYITDPPCAFIEAVVAGYSPVDRWTCHFARIAAKMRQEPWWAQLPQDPRNPALRGEVRSFRTRSSVYANVLHGECHV